MNRKPRLRFIFLLGAGLYAPVAFAQQTAPDNYYPGQVMFSPREEAIYQDRYEKAQVRVNAEDIYVDREEIVGAAPWTPLPAAAPGERTISDVALTEATSYAAKNNSNAFIVWRKGKVELEAYFGDHTRTSLVNSLSLSKPVTALAVGRAMKLGHISSLDQPVADYVEEWRGDPVRRMILIRHLLDMRSGFLPQLPVQGPDDVMSRTFLHPRHDEIIVAEYPVVDAPGTRYEYNNAASDMVAVLIQRATGQSYTDFLGTEIWQKVGALGGMIWVNRPGGTAHAGCCMMVPAEDFLRLGILMLQDGTWQGDRLLPEGFVEEMITPTDQNPYFGLTIWVAGRYIERRGFSNPDRGLPGVLHTEPYLADDLYLFDGNANQVVYVIPSQDLVILRTGLRPRPDGGGEWDNAALPNTLMRGIIKNKGISTPQAR